MECDELATLHINEDAQMNIEDLSDDVLRDIFDFLDKGALKRSSRVCQRWQNLIVNSTALTQRLTFFFKSQDYLNTPDEYVKKFNQILETKAVEFPYINFKAYIDEPKGTEIWDKVQDIFFKFVKDPLKVELKSVPPSVATRYIKLSASTLTHLNLSYNNDEICIFDLPLELPNLVSLRLFQNAIPKSLIAPKLKDFRYHRVRKNSTPVMVNLEDFLIRSVNLQKLETCAIPTFERGAIKFQLEELVITSNGLDLEAFKGFLISQQKSLKKLRLQDDQVEFREFVNVIIQHTRIEQLKILSRYNLDNEIPIVEEFNNSVKKLSICVYPVRTLYVVWPRADYIIGTLKKFHAVENLTLMVMDDFETIFEQVDLSNLKSLNISFKKGNNFKNFKDSQILLEKMEELKIEYINDKQEVLDLLKIASFCPNLKILNLGKLNYPNWKTEFIKMSHFEVLFRNSPNIVDLVVEGCAYLLSSFMFSIKTVESNLQRLKVGVYCEGRIPKMLAKLKGAKFVCDIHYYNTIGMKPVPWYEEEVDYQKKLGEDD